MIVDELPWTDTIHDHCQQQDQGDNPLSGMLGLLVIACLRETPAIFLHGKLN
jgi:hypothetical protein